jgi:UDP-N-acetylmuramate--alanine ligase
MSLSHRCCRVHFIGIGGIGMSGIAELLHHLGHTVSGSDLFDNDQIKKLKAKGVKIQQGHSVDILNECKPEVLVYSNAVKKDNVERLWAKENAIPLIRRAEMLAELMRLKRGISVAGSHGKTTTTGMISYILKVAGLEPTVVIGGKFAAIGSNASWGGGDWLVAESDESDGSFLHLSPEMAVVTNIDFEHMDHYGGVEQLQKTFLEFLERIPFYGRAVLCADSELLYELREQIQRPSLWYAFEKKEKAYHIRLQSKEACPSFEVYCPKGEKLFESQLKVPGLHNVSNAVAAALICLELQVKPEIVSKALSEFEGVERRFQKRGLWQGHPIYEDYGHHPTEIIATLKAAKAMFADKKILVVFQPHRYSRTKLLWDRFKNSFVDADCVMTLPIYAGGEKKSEEDEAFDREGFSDHLKAKEKIFCEDFADLKNKIEKYKDLKEVGPIFFLGAGDVGKAINLFVV